MMILEGRAPLILADMIWQTLPAAVLTGLVAMLLCRRLLRIGG
jgi:hypothetical protein